jgi:hypothetical protein
MQQPANPYDQNHMVASFTQLHPELQALLSHPWWLNWAKPRGGEPVHCRFGACLEHQLHANSCAVCPGEIGQQARCP